MDTLYNLSKTWFTSSSSSSSPAMTDGKETESFLTWAEQIELQDAAVGSNVGLLCWTIYLANQLSKRTTQEVEKSMVERLRRRNRGKLSDEIDAIDNTNDEQKDGKSTSGESRLRSSGRAKYNLISHMWSLMGLKEGVVCVSVASLLFLRTLCDLRMIRLSAMIETSIISRKPVMIKDAIKNYILHIIPYSMLTALLRYAQDELKVTMRESLALKMQELFMSNNAFLHLESANCDQILTTDLEEFTTIMSELFSICLEPTVNVVVYVISLWEIIGPRHPTTMLAYFGIMGYLLGYLRGPTSEFIYNEQVLEGEHRGFIARILQHAEEIASLSGAKRELSTLTTSLYSLLTHLRNKYMYKATVNTLDQVFARYLSNSMGWGLLGYSLMQTEELSQFEDTKRYQVLFRMTNRLSFAVSQLMLTGRAIARGKGLGERIQTFLDELKALKTKSNTSPPPTSKPSYEKKSVNKAHDPLVCIHVNNLQTTDPTGVVLVSNLTFEVKRNDNLLIVGPNGSGKSTVLRYLSSLRMLECAACSIKFERRSGEIFRGDELSLSDLFYLPQTPYMTVGRLIDQVIYPLSLDEAIAKLCLGLSYAETDMSSTEWKEGRERDLSILSNYVADILMNVDLPDHSSEIREDPNTSADWGNVLSGGERQKLSIARLLFHRPKYALLDESTSAVSPEIEESLYARCIEAGVTLVTVSHRPSAAKYHQQRLRLDGEGGYTIERISQEKLKASISSPTSSKSISSTALSPVSFNSLLQAYGELERRHREMKTQYDEEMDQKGRELEDALHLLAAEKSANELLTKEKFS